MYLRVCCNRPDGQELPLEIFHQLNNYITIMISQLMPFKILKFSPPYKIISSINPHFPKNVSQLPNSQNLSKSSSPKGPKTLK